MGNPIGNIGSLPPAYIEPSNPHTWLTDIFDSPFGLPCICGDQTPGQDLAVVRPYIIRICQREDEPCKIDVDFHLGTAQGVYNYNPNVSGFSFDTTDGQNGIWHQLRPDVSDAGHNPALNNPTLAGTNQVDSTWDYAQYNPNNPLHVTADPCVPDWVFLGIPVHTFVFDMCEHVSSWFSEQDVSIRLYFDKDEQNTFPSISCGVNFHVQ